VSRKWDEDFFAAAAFANYLERKPRLYAVTGWVNSPEQRRVNLSERHRDGPMFRLYASRLEQLCKAKRIEQLDGLDQRYWDYDVDGSRVVLHSDPMAGISLHVEDGSRDDLLRGIVARITEPDAARNAAPPHR
jgi:hypothetical protein